MLMNPFPALPAAAASSALVGFRDFRDLRLRFDAILFSYEMERWYTWTPDEAGKQFVWYRGDQKLQDPSLWIAPHREKSETDEHRIEWRHRSSYFPPALTGTTYKPSPSA